MTDGLRIVRVMPYFEPAARYGGCVTHAGVTSARLAARGHRLHVVTTDLGVGAELPRDTWVDRDGYRVYYAAARRAQRHPPYPPAHGVAGVLAERLADADILVLNVGLTLLGGRARKLARAAGVPYVYNAEGALCPHRLGIKKMRKQLFLRAVERGVLRDAAALQAVTEKEAQDLARQGAAPDCIHVIPNGVEIATAPRSHLADDDKTTTILFLGRLDTIKGIDLLLDATAPLLAERETLRLVIAGPDDGCRAALERRADQLGVRGRVTFPGMLGPDERRHALAAADIFALTSRSEGLPLAVLEAAAAGLPLVITDRCNIPEVDRFEAGRVTAPEAPRITEALRALVVDSELRRRCAENARRMAEDVFAMDRIVERLESLYRSTAQ